MDWISGIGRDSHGRLHVEAQWLDSPRTWTDISRLTADIGIEGAVRRRVELPLHQARLGDINEYLSGLGLSELDATCQQVYEFETAAGVVVIPSQLLVLATVGAHTPFRRALLKPWGPSFLMTAIDQQGEYDIAPALHRPHDLQMERGPSMTRMRWLLAYPSATAAWCSVYAYALKGRFDMTPPKAIATASLRATLVGGKLLVTRLQLLKMQPTEEPFEFAAHAPRHFVLNETILHRPAHGKAALPSSDEGLTRGGPVTPLTDAEWLNLEPVLEGFLKSPNTKRPGQPRKHSLRELIDTIRLKLGTPYPWSKCPGSKPLVQSASALLSKLQRGGMWEQVAAAREQRPAATSPSTPNGQLLTSAGSKRQDMHMKNDKLILRTIYLDPAVDDLLRDRAEERAVSKAALLRGYLQAGMKAVKAGTMLLENAPLSESILVLRTCHIDPKVDSQLQIEAFHTPTSKNDLYRRYIALGIHAEVASEMLPKGGKTKSRSLTSTAAAP